MKLKELANARSGDKGSNANFGAIAKTKQLIHALCSRRFQEDFEMCLVKYIQVRKGLEAQEGIRAFLDKRKPAWHKS